MIKISRRKLHTCNWNSHRFTAYDIQSCIATVSKTAWKEDTSIYRVVL